MDDDLVIFLKGRKAIMEMVQTDEKNTKFDLIIRIKEMD